MAWDDFDPNENPLAMWATYVPSRRRTGAFKLHKTRGPALNAMSCELRAILYEFRDGRWHMRAKLDYGDSYPNRPKTCENCGGSTMADGGNWNRGKVTRIKPGLDFKFLCSACARMVS